MKNWLLSLDQDWQVWTDWYEDRLRGANHPGSRPIIEELEIERVKLVDEHFHKGPKVVNAMLAELEARYRNPPLEVPPQRPAIIEVEYGEDGRLHRKPSHPSDARDAAQDRRRRSAWGALSAQVAVLVDLDPGGNIPGFTRAVRDYRVALGLAYEDLDVVALGTHGFRIEGYAAGARDIFMEEAAAEVTAFAASHGLFVRQFPEWHEYLTDAQGEAPDATVEAALPVAAATLKAHDLIGADVSEPLAALAEVAVPADNPPEGVKREYLRSLGNVLAGMFGPVLDYARDAGAVTRKESLVGIGELAKLAPKVLAFAAAAEFVDLAAAYPATFGWLKAAVEFLRLKLDK